jgi:Zn-finger nucleic acid-binding protein
MNCPLCLDTVLDITYHGGIELDICPRCRGIWLDRGELEKLAAADAPSDTPRQRELESSRSPQRSVEERRGPRKKRLSQRLGDVFEEVLDF